MHTSKERSTKNKQEKIPIDASSPVYYVHEYVGQKIHFRKMSANLSSTGKTDYKP